MCVIVFSGKDLSGFISMCVDLFSERSFCCLNTKIKGKVGKRMAKKYQDYVNEMALGDLIAFRLYEKDAKMYSGKVTKIGDSRIEVQTKNGTKYFVDKKNVAWINKNGHWPHFVMNGFQGIGKCSTNPETCN